MAGLQAYKRLLRRVTFAAPVSTEGI